VARRPSLIKVKSKKFKKSKSEQYLINHKAFGDEPTYTSKLLTQTQLTNCYNWYNYMCDLKEAKEYLLTYLKNAARFDDVEKLKALPDKFVPTTVAWQARMRSMGATLPESSKEYFDNTLKTVFSDAQRRAGEYQDEPDGDNPKETQKAPQKPSVQDRGAARYDFLACQIEEAIDDFLDNWSTKFSMIEWLKANEVNNATAKRLHDKYNPELLEIENAATTDDNEGYTGYSKSSLKKLYGFFVMLVEDLELHMQNEKKVRKPRVAKPVTADKKLKDFKYLKFANVLNIQSVQPEKLLGAAELWTFNIKYNQLTVFKMEDPQVGLDVYRTAITKFDPKTSKTIKLRANKVDAALKEVLGAGKVALRKMMDTLTGSDQKLQERMNENTILLRVVPR
jgi:hypothetical protein